MYPWHKLVCDDLHRGHLPEATIDFVQEAGRSRGRTTRRRELQDVPDRVLRLIERRRSRRRIDDNDITAYMDFETELGEDDPAVGIIVFDDRRS
jgi:hypothetical protein